MSTNTEFEGNSKTENNNGWATGFEWTDDASGRTLLLSGEGEVQKSAITNFFVEAGRTIHPDTLSMCQQCPVRRECLDHSFDGFDGKPMPAGYFAGFSHGQRDKFSHDSLKVIVETESAQYRK